MTQIYKWTLIVGGVIIAAMIFAQHFELVLVPCSSACAKLMAWPGTKLASLGAVLSTLGLAYCEANGMRKQFSVLARLAAGCGLVLLVVMIQIKGACYLCLTLDAILLAIALLTFERTPVVMWTSAIPAAIAVLVLGEAVYSRTVVPKITYFQCRSYEPPFDHHMDEIAIFSDPECPACKRLADLESQITRRDVRIRYRWLLITGSPSSMRAAIAVEAACKADYSKGVAFRRMIFAEDPPLSDAKLVSTALSLGMEKDVKAALANPPADILATLSEDARVAKQARLTEVPSVTPLAEEVNTRRIVMTYAKTEIINSILANQPKEKQK